MTEIQPYDVEREYEGFELRRYPEHLLVEVDVDGEFFRAGNLGFRPLIGYISGNNADGSKIAMTAPVTQRPHAGSSYTIGFVMPADMDASALPEPSDSRVHTRTVPPGRVAARRFSGGADESRFSKNEVDLLAAVAEAGLGTIDSPWFARYDAPWKPGFVRRNEVLIRVAETDGARG